MLASRTNSEVVPGQSLKAFAGPRGNGKTRNGIQVFSAKRYDAAESFLAENEVSLAAFAEVVKSLCVEVFGLQLVSVAIYYEPGGSTIAFNSNRSYFLNFRFFHALHFLQNTQTHSECYSYWFVVIWYVAPGDSTLLLAPEYSLFVF